MTGPEVDGAPAGVGRPRAHRVLGGAIAVVGVLAFSLLAWRKLLRGETDLWVVAAAVAVVWARMPEDELAHPLRDEPDELEPDAEPDATPESVEV